MQGSRIVCSGKSTKRTGNNLSDSPTEDHVHHLTAYPDNVCSTVPQRSKRGGGVHLRAAFEHLAGRGVGWGSTILSSGQWTMEAGVVALCSWGGDDAGREMQKGFVFLHILYS